MARGRWEKADSTGWRAVLLPENEIRNVEGVMAKQGWVDRETVDCMHARNARRIQSVNK